MPGKNILFLSKPESVTTLFSRIKEAGMEASLADSLKGALKHIETGAPAIVFSRPNLPGYRVEDLLAEAGKNPDRFPPVVVFTDKGSADEARKFLELGARDYWLEPLQWEKIQAALPEEKAQTPEPGPKVKGLSFKVIGGHVSFKRALSLARQVAKSRATVLITGSSGTGKEMFARYLHHMSDRADRPFVAINCAALPEHLLESELFGHEKGAFTGAVAKKPGRFDLADGGTMLLDEISEMAMPLQAKLLRVLQEGEFDRVGGVETIRVDVRVLATTNRDLEKYVEDGKFRQDLFYRLNVIPLKLPDLCERGDDVYLLADYFVDYYCRAYSLAFRGFTDKARAWLAEYRWPGNVRELQNLMERAVLLSRGGPIDTAHFLLDETEWPVEEEAGPEEDLGLEGPGTSIPPARASEILGDKNMSLQEVEKRVILERLGQTEGNRTQAANLLGISVRTLRNKLNEYRKQGLEVP